MTIARTRSADASPTLTAVVALTAFVSALLFAPCADAHAADLGRHPAASPPPPDAPAELPPAFARVTLLPGLRPPGLRNAGERFLETAGETLLDLVLAVGLIPAATDSTSSDQNQRAVGYLVDGLLLFGAGALAIGELRERNGSVGIIVFSLAIAVITALLAADAIHLDVLAERDSASARAAPPASLKLAALRF